MGILRILGVAGGALSLTLVANVASAQGDDDNKRPYALVEVTGAYGFHLGTTEYLPDGAPTVYKHPIVNGPAVGITAGGFATSVLAFVLNYEYGAAWTREGEIAGVLSSVQGTIQYHTLTVGPRLVVPLGYGRIRAEFGIGVIMPYDTELEFEYAPELAAVGITGTGRRIENFNEGPGAQGLVGYEFPLGDYLYLALDAKLKAFQSNNSNEETELENFVTDFEAQPPTPTTAAILHRDGAARPSTNSVQVARIGLSFGARF